MTADETERAKRFIDKIDEEYKKIISRYLAGINSQQNISKEAKSFIMNDVLGYYEDVLKDAKDQSMRVLEGTLVDDWVPF